MAKKPSNPDEAALRAHALAYPEVTEDFPWGHRALKVRGKMFVIMGTGEEANMEHGLFSITCKLPVSGVMALSLAGAEPTGYGMGKSGWVTARFPPGKAPVPMLIEWIDESYRAVAPKRLVKGLGGAGAVGTKVAPARKAGAAVLKKPVKKKAAAKR